MVRLTHGSVCIMVLESRFQYSSVRVKNYINSDFQFCLGRSNISF